MDTTKLADIAGAVDFSLPACGHTASRFLVSRVIGDQIMIICEECFNKVKEADLLSQRWLLPLVIEDCLLCMSRAPCRRFPDLAAFVCDGCSANQGGYGRTPPLGVVPDKVCDGLFIGSKDSAYDMQVLTDLGISRILVCCSALDAYHYPSNRSIHYHRLPIQDSLAQSLEKYLPSARAFIAQGILNGESTLVHCNAGVSRSGAVVVDWLLQTRPDITTVEEACVEAKTKRSLIFPNSNFITQLKSIYE